ncbi:MAG: RagB/SusD family nutrient uptake outer membrane protein [Cyclobacteriaceae bacterium]
MKKKILILLSAIAVFSSCADQLNLTPFNTIDSSLATGTSKDIEALMVGAYTFLGDGDVLGGNMQRDAELIGDAYPSGSEMFWDGTFVDPGEVWTKSMLVTNGQAELTWLDAYRAINICNTVLANLDVVQDEKVDRIEGEAKFIRGTIYFELVRVFARTWTDINGTPATNPGVPLVLEPNVTGLVDRNTVAEVYTQVITDLQDAETLLPASNGFFATTYSASAMLSRVYLMQNNYPAARDAADRVIQSGEYDLLSNYADNFNNSSNGSTNATIEDVFAIQVTTQAGINNMNTFFATSDFGGRGDIYIEPAHFALYEAGDERLDLFYDGERTGKWNNQFGNVNIIRLAEMYLTRAEANLQAGTTIGDTPLNDVNAIRNRVGLTDLGSVTVSDVLNERHLELAFEGHLIHDLKRTQRPVGTLTFDAPELIFPIPNREIQINPDLEQNEGYD